MCRERIALLENLGFLWNVRKGHWEDMYQKLKRFKEVHGHCKVSKVSDIIVHLMRIVLSDWND